MTMDRHRLLVGCLAWPYATPGYGNLTATATAPVLLTTGATVRAVPDATNPRVAIVRYAGKLYRVPAEYLAPVEE